MEDKVIFRDRQECQADDFNNIQLFAEKSIDDIVLDAIDSGYKFTGFGVTQTAPFGVTVANGRAYAAGSVWKNEDANGVPLNFLGSKPLLYSTIVAIVAVTGATVDSDVQPRDFQIDVDTNDVEPDEVAMLRTRKASIVGFPGQEAAVPLPPVLSNSQIPVAFVTLTSAGITDISINTAAQLTSVGVLAPIVIGLEAQVASDSAFINSLLATSALQDAAILSLKNQLTAQSLSFQAQLTALLNKIAGLPTSTGGATAVYTIVDYYNDLTGLIAGAGFSLGGGLGFPASGTSGTVVVSNPSSGYIATPDNKLLPAYQEVTFFSPKPPTATMPFNRFSPLSVTPKQEGYGLFRLRYGASLPAQSSANLSSNTDPTGLFSQNPGDLVYDGTWPDWRANNPELNHQNGYYKDVTSRGYWTSRISKASTSGLPAVGFKVQPGQDVMFTGFDLNVVKGTSGDIRMLIVDNVGVDTSSLVGTQRVLNPILADITCPYAAIDPSANIEGIYGVAAFNARHPVYLKNKQYTFVFLSSGDHLIKVVTGTMNGQFGSTGYLSTPDLGLNWNNITSANGAQLGGVSGRMRVAQFTPGTIEVPLNPIAAAQTDKIDIELPVILPAGTDLNVGILVNGSYVPLGPINPNDATTNLLASRPNLLSLSLEMTATKYTAPMVNLGVPITPTPQAGVSGATQGAAMSALSAIRAPKDSAGNPLTVVKITSSVVLIGFNPTIHTYGETLQTGANFATTAQPTNVVGPTLQADGTYTMSFSWTVNPGIQQFQIGYNGTASSATKTFRVSQATTAAYTA